MQRFTSKEFSLLSHFIFQHLNEERPARSIGNSKEMSTSMKIIDMFNIKDEDGRGIKKETSQRVLSDLMPPCFGILLADMQKYQCL